MEHTIESLPVSKVLSRAVEVLHEVGWCQGTLGTFEGHPVESQMFSPTVQLDGVCLVGSLMMAIVGLTGEPWNPALGQRPDSYTAAIKQVERVLDSHRGYIGSISSWNDAAVRTKDHVVAMIEAAAADARERGE